MPSTGGKILTRGPTDNKSVSKKGIDAWDRYRKAVISKRLTSNTSSGSTSPGSGDTYEVPIDIKRASVVSTSSTQTVFDFTGTDVDGFTNATTNMLVFVNGLLQDKTDDYTVGSDTITLTTAIGIVGAKVQVVRFEVE